MKVLFLVLAVIIILFLLLFLFVFFFVTTHQIKTYYLLFTPTFLLIFSGYVYTYVPSALSYHKHNVLSFEISRHID